MTKHLEHHRIDWTINNGGRLSHDLTCSAPAGAPCRLTCAEDCEQFAFTGHEHDLEDAGGCQLLLFLDLDLHDLLDNYTGPEAPLTSGPIILEYDDLAVTWSYPPSTFGLPERSQFLGRLQFARETADPNFSLSVPEPAKQLIRELITHVESTDQRLAEQHQLDLAMHRAYRPEAVTEIAVNLTDEVDWEPIATWTGGTIITHGPDQNGEHSSTLHIPNVGDAWPGSWITLDHHGTFRIRTEVSGPETPALAETN